MSQFGLPPAPPQILGQPGANYAPMGGTGNIGLDMMLAGYAAPMLQSFMGGKFIPQQFPAQGLLDQMMSSKWQRSAQANLAQAQATDQQAMYSTLAAIRARTTNTPMSGLQQQHLNTFAGMLNNSAAMTGMGMLFGEQNVEDAFFGRRGSAVRLANAANRIGFYRSDAVTGKDRMSEDSLRSFSSQVYSNLYGPDADLNDVSGFSAGRVGDLMTDLAQRGILPASMSKLSASERRRAFRDVGGSKMQLSENLVEDQAIKSAMDRGAGMDELTKFSGGAEAVRKIDATRVSNALKGYTDSLSVVRQIFGDNGVTNAPMQQLMAAMEALTQNSMSSMSSGKIENLMRRTQMASRDSGVSLETLMGLSSRGGALADQYGLARELAGGSVITAMEHGRAMRDTGMFNPAFGRMDPNKAALTVLDQSMRADASPVGRYLAVASRLAAENVGNKGFENSNMAKMVEAMQRGETSYYDTTENRTVDIYKEFGTNPDKIMRRMLGETGISVDRFGALYRDKNTQEFQIAGAARNVQAAGLKSKLGSHLASQTGIAERIGGGLDTKQKAALAQQIGSGLSTALIDNVNHTMSATERLSALKGAFNQSAIDFARQQLGAGASAADVMAYAQKISGVGDDNIMGFKTEADLNEFLSTRQANAGTFTERRYGQGIESLRQTFNSRTLTEGQNRTRRNINRAGIEAGTQFDDGSNLLQRVSDMLGGKGHGTALEQILGAVDSGAQRDALMQGITGGEAAMNDVFTDIQKAYAAGTVSSDAAKKKFVDETTASNFAARAKQFVGTAAESEFRTRTRYMKNSTVAQMLTAATTDENLGHVKAIYMKHTGATQETANAVFADPAKRQAAMAEMAGISGIEDSFAERGIKTGIGRDVMTEARFAKINEHTDAFGAGTTPADRARMAALGRISKEWDRGETQGSSVLAVYGLTNDDAELKKAMGEFMEKGGGTDAVAARLKQLGVSDDRIEKIVATAQFSRNVNTMGGFAVVGAGGTRATEVVGRASRQTAFEAAVKENRVQGRMADLVKKEQSNTISADEKKELAAFYETEDKFKQGLDNEYAASTGIDSKKAATDKIVKESQKLTAQATGAKDPTGIGDAISSSIGPAIAEAFKTAIAELAKAAGFGGALNLSGQLTLVGLEKVLADFTGKPEVSATPAGAPVVGNSGSGKQ